jgi:hypothetical protein
MSDKPKAKLRVQPDAIAKEVADGSKWAAYTDNYDRIFQAARRGAEIALARLPTDRRD